MLMATMTVIASVVLSAGGIQTPGPTKVGLEEYLKSAFAGVARDLVAAAERMPEADAGSRC